MLASVSERILANDEDLVTAQWVTDKVIERIAHPHIDSFPQVQQDIVLFNSVQSPNFEVRTSKDKDQVAFLEDTTASSVPLLFHRRDWVPGVLREVKDLTTTNVIYLIPPSKRKDSMALFVVERREVSTTVNHVGHLLETSILFKEKDFLEVYFIFTEASHHQRPHLVWQVAYTWEVWKLVGRLNFFHFDPFIVSRIKFEGEERPPLEPNYLLLSLLGRFFVLWVLVGEELLVELGKLLGTIVFIMVLEEVRTLIAASPLLKHLCLKKLPLALLKELFCILGFCFGFLVWPFLPPLDSH